MTTENVRTNRDLMRGALADWIGNASIPNLNKVFTSFPKKISFQLLAETGQLNRAVGVVHFSSQTESRVAWGGAYSGWKKINYTTEFQIFHHSAEKTGEDAMNSFDAIVDGVLGILRAGGHTLGLTDGSVWEVAEQNVNASFGEPWINGNGYLEIWASLQFTSTQMIKA